MFLVVGPDASPFKPTAREPEVTEVVQTPSPPHPRRDVQEQEQSYVSYRESAMISPTPSMGESVRVNKRPQNYSRTMGSIQASFGRFTNSFVREQHATFRRKCHHELGAGIDDHAFDTSYNSFVEWIKSERLRRLPHKGGSWDRVLIAAQYFAEQVSHFHSHIESFTEDCSAATNFVFGQCLLLLEVGDRFRLQCHEAN